MATSPSKEALKQRSQKINTPTPGNKDPNYIFDARDAGNYHVKLTPLRREQVLRSVKTVELHEAAAIQVYRPAIYDELKHRGYFEKKDQRAVVLHDPTYEEELSPQQRAAITRAKKKAEEELEAKKRKESHKKPQPQEPEPQANGQDQDQDPDDPEPEGEDTETTPAGS